jgi:hypothetical protein
MRNAAPGPHSPRYSGVPLVWYCARVRGPVAQMERGRGVEDGEDYPRARGSFSARAWVALLQQLRGVLIMKGWLASEGLEPLDPLPRVGVVVDVDERPGRVRVDDLREPTGKCFRRGNAAPCPTNCFPTSSLAPQAASLSHCRDFRSSRADFYGRRSRYPTEASVYSRPTT